MNKQLFLDLCDHLKNEVPELRFIDWDEGQLNIVGEKPPVLFPCCLIDLQYPSCRDLDGVNQLVTTNIILKIGFMPAGETNTNAPANVRDRALGIFDTIDKIHQSLQGETMNDTVSEIGRRRAIKSVRKDGIIVFTATYDTTFEEYD